ncbi:MAG TPA: GNAT family N-acetyltransferase [Mycobacteriales bacterium]|nr:GNAT family N-acetyltransferase [Mycobacteriales bacterium]
MTSRASNPAALTSPAARARGLWHATAAQAGITVLPLDSLAAVRDAADLFAQIWRTEPGKPPLTADVMRAVEHAGGYVFGAYDGTRLVGASSGFLGMNPQPTLHSHISGVLAPGRQIGLALKLHQRAWALDRGISTITWTFDPLVRRNAWFNLRKLGAVGVEYLVDFYGPMSDGLNGGESSDRLFTRWSLVESLAGVTHRDVDGLTVLMQRDGAPWPAADLPGDGRRLLVCLPEDIEALRGTDPDAGRAWRVAVREALVPAFAAGYRATGMTNDGCFILET